MHLRCKPLAVLLPTLFVAALAQAQQQLALLEPVVVTATRQPSRTNELIADVTIVDREELDQAGPAATLGEILGRQPGIEFSRQGGRGATEGIFIRGTNTGHALILVDGLRVGSATLGATSIGDIPLSQIERIEIVRGAASAVYGTDAIGGVINLLTRTGDGPRLQANIGGGSQGTQDATLSHSGRIGNLRYGLRLGTLNTEGINTVVNRSSFAYNPDKDGYNRRNASFQLAYKLSEAVEIGANYMDIRSESHFDGSWPTANADWREQHRIVGEGVYVTLRPIRGWVSSVRAGRGIDRSVTRPGSDIGLEKDTFETTQDQFSWQNDIDLPVGRLLAVVEHLDQKVESTKAYSLKSREIDSLSLGWTGSVRSHRFQVNTRHDHNSQFGNRNTETLGYGYQLTKAWRASALYGTAFKAPTLNDLYYPNTPFAGVGNPNLRPEFARNRELAIHYEHGEQRASLTYFHNNVENLIQWEETAPSSFFYTPMNVGKARISGWTAEYSGRLGAWRPYTNLSVQSPEDTETGKLLVRRSRQFATLGFTHEAGNVVWGAEIKGSGHRYDDAANTRRLGGYGIVNVHARYSLDRQWTLFGRVDNLFDKHYEYARSSSTVYGNLGTVVFVGFRYTLD